MLVATTSHGFFGPHLALGAVWLRSAPRITVSVAVMLPFSSAVVSTDPPNFDGAQSPGPVMFRPAGQIATAIGPFASNPVPAIAMSWPLRRSDPGVTVNVWLAEPVSVLVGVGVAVGVAVAESVGVAVAVDPPTYGIGTAAVSVALAMFVAVNEQAFSGPQIVAGGVELPSEPTTTVNTAWATPFASAVTNFDAPDDDGPQSPGPATTRPAPHSLIATGALAEKPVAVTVTCWPEEKGPVGENEMPTPAAEALDVASTATDPAATISTDSIHTLRLA